MKDPRTKAQIAAAQKHCDQILAKARARPITSVHYTHVGPDGRQYPWTFSSCFEGHAEEMRDQFIKDIKRIEEHGLNAVMQEWHDEEAKERRKLGLKVKERY